MPESQVDRLKRELKFLKESFEAGIISEEEFLKGKKRIEKKLDEWGEGVIEEYGRKPQTIQEVSAEDIIEEVKEEQQRTVTQTINAKKDFTDEQIKERIKHQEEKEGIEQELDETKMQLEETKKQLRDAEKEKSKKTTIIQKLEKEIKKRDEKITELKNKKKNGKTFNAWKYVSIILIAAIILLLFTKISTDTTNIPLNQTQQNTTETCKTDTDCNAEQGKVGICTLTNETTSCEYILTPEVEMIVLNDKNCTKCDTTKTVQLIKQLFPETTTITSFDYNNEQGKTLYQAYNIKYLPAYIFSKNLEQTNTWRTNERLRASFTQQTNKYVLNAESTGANYTPKN
jgi:hypothetical protein